MSEYYTPHPFKEKRICEVCGKSYIAKSWIAKICSDECRLIKRPPKTRFYKQRQCANCQKVFQPKNSHHVYCSRQCAIDFRKKGLNVCAKKNKEYFLEKFYFICHNCKEQFPPSALDVHHIIPLYQGGTDTEDNITILCRKCHFEQHCQW